MNKQNLEATDDNLGLEAFWFQFLLWPITCRWTVRGSLTSCAKHWGITVLQDVTELGPEEPEVWANRSPMSLYWIYRTTTSQYMALSCKWDWEEITHVTMRLRWQRANKKKFINHTERSQPPAHSPLHEGCFIQAPQHTDTLYSNQVHFCFTARKEAL